MSDVETTPAPGIKTINQVRGRRRNIDITSNDGSIVITPDSGTNTVDLAINPEAIGLIPDVPCDSSVYIGAWVYVDDSGVAYNAIATSKDTSNVVGIVESKASSTLATIRYLGVSDIVFVGLEPKKNYMLSDTVAGSMMTVAPVGAGKAVVGLGQPINSTKFLVDKKIRMMRS